MEKTLLVIGNGFDLDIGLKTSYGDFIRANYINGNKCMSTNELVRFIVNCYMEANWIDIELCLKNYAIELSKHERENPNIRGEFYELCRDLNAYMCEGIFSSSNYNQFGKFLYNEHSCAKAMLEFVSVHKDILIYSFNYIKIQDILRLLKTTFNIDIPIEDTRIKYMHGNSSIVYNDRKVPIVLGFDANEDVNDEYSFMVKKSEYKEDFIKSLDESCHIILYGIGLGVCDAPYFRKFFNTLSESDKKISVFTKGNGDNLKERLKSDYGVEIEKINSHISFYDTGKYDVYSKFFFDTRIS